jgi:hypothetical protein
MRSGSRKSGCTCTNELAFLNSLWIRCKPGLKFAKPDLIAYALENSQIRFGIAEVKLLKSTD